MQNSQGEEAAIARSQDGCLVFASAAGGGIGGDKSTPTCGYYDYWVIKFCDTTVTTSITQLPNTQLHFSISPNPFTEELVIRSQEPGEIIIYDVFGRMIYSQNLLTVNSKLQTVNWSNGIYFVEVITDEGSAVKKVVKQ